MVVHCGQLGGSWNYVSFSEFNKLVFCFFFLISKNDIYTKGNSMHEEYRANREIQEKENREKQKRKPNKRKITKKKGNKEKKGGNH